MEGSEAGSGASADVGDAERELLAVATEQGGDLAAGVVLTLQAVHEPVRPVGRDEGAGGDGGWGGEQSRAGGQPDRLRGAVANAPDRGRREAGEARHLPCADAGTRELLQVRPGGGGDGPRGAAAARGPMRARVRRVGRATADAATPSRVRSTFPMSARSRSRIFGRAAARGRGRHDVQKNGRARVARPGRCHGSLA